MTQAINVDPTLAVAPSRVKPLLAVALVVVVVGLLGPRLLFDSSATVAEDTASFPEAGTAATTTVPRPPAEVTGATSPLPTGAGPNPFASRGAPNAAPAPVAAVAPPPTTVPPTAARSTARLRVLEISLDGTRRPLARVRVDDVAQTVTVGQAFAQRYTLEALDVPGRCGRFVAAGIRFTLCEGDERLA